MIIDGGVSYNNFNWKWGRPTVAPKKKSGRENFSRGQKFTPSYKLWLNNRTSVSAVHTGPEVSLSGRELASDWPGSAWIGTKEENTMIKSQRLINEFTPGGAADTVARGPCA